jgi:hypothetical protein
MRCFHPRYHGFCDIVACEDVSGKRTDRARVYGVPHGHRSTLESILYTHLYPLSVTVFPSGTPRALEPRRMTAHAAR